MGQHLSGRVRCLKESELGTCLRFLVLRKHDQKLPMVALLVLFLQVLMEAETLPPPLSAKVANGGFARSFSSSSDGSRDPSATTFSVDGIGTNDHVLCAAMLQRMERMPVARSLLPFCASLQLHATVG